MVRNKGSIMMQKVILNTDGSGYWSRSATQVTVTDMQIGYVNDEKDFGELRVYFSTQDWDCNKLGLIYTDRAWLKELGQYLDSVGLTSTDVSYSEQGMQGDDYVSLDVGGKFLQLWTAKFGELVV
jgi:hypothetical protein